ncbi:MAG: CBS domain-containing protein, partial [Chloroflexota bacterium]
MTQVRDLMSYGALTVQAGRRLADIVGRLRRIGHEGYPVVDTDGQIVGLLTARDMNRATENGLEDMRVEDVMMAGQVSVSPETAVHALLAQMVATDWGQIPVVENNALVGIVTRTDVIRHYAQLEYNSIHTVTDAEVRRVLGEPIAALIAFVAKQAAAQEKTIYMVGGVVRDLLLKRPNLDIDFVLEGDAMAFAQSLDEEFGGVVKTHEAFGTATWTFDDTAAGHIGQPLDALPEYIDLVTTRFEFYEEPAVLPTVYNSGIRLDLRRRDFTINALAVKLSANGAGGEVIDLFGGLRDLEHKQVRVLHSLSFADDPTRILRGVRFAHRLGFKIEPRTAQLIENALPMLKRTTGERLRNEITLLLKEPEPEAALLKLQSMGVLQAIHPAFVLDADLLRRGFTQLQAEPLIHPPEEEGMLRWVLVATSMDAEYAEQVANRMLFKKATTQ